MRRPLVFLSLLLAVPAAAPAVAQDRPPLTPTRDVAVTYRMTGPNVPAGMGAVVMAWNAAGGLVRSELPGMGWMVADMRSGRAFMVVEQVRAIMEMPATQLGQAIGYSDKASFRREGSATIAGLPCTIWAVQDGASQGRACITADGVMLRGEGSHQGQSGGMEATQVSFAPQDPARFQRPPGYQAMQGLPPGAGFPLAR